MVIKDLIISVMAGAAMLLLPACNGIMDGIYDEPVAEADLDYGFVMKPSNPGEVGTIYIDASDYGRWTYINFHDMSIDTLDVGVPEPADWDIAIHRYDCKTNGGSAAETGATGFGSMESLLHPAAEAFVADVWTTETIITDMSTMMDGYLSYEPSMYNAELSKWLNVDTSQMPPIYTPSGRVYVVKLADGTAVALKFSDFTNSAGVKGYLTIQYVYPFQL